MLQKGAYHQENQKIQWEFQHLFKTDHFWPWAVPLRVSPHVPVAFGVDWLFLHQGHTIAIICNYRGLCQWMHAKSSLQIICTYRYGAVTQDMSVMPFEKLTNILSSYWVDNKIKYQLKYIWSNEAVKFKKKSIIWNVPLLT